MKTRINVVEVCEGIERAQIKSIVVYRGDDNIETQMRRFPNTKDKWFCRDTTPGSVPVTLANLQIQLANHAGPFYTVEQVMRIAAEAIAEHNDLSSNTEVMVEWVVPR